MAEKSGFFNALLMEGEYDRKYNADDYCENLALIISSGVLRSENDDLKVTKSGMTVSVAAGRGWIKGHWYKNTAPMALQTVTAPVSGKRYDRVVLRYDGTVAERRVYLLYVQGTASANPTPPAPVRTDTIYDLVLADIYSEAGLQSITVTDKRSDNEVCGWVYSTSGDNSFFETFDNTFAEWFEEKRDTLASVTLFKRYTQIQTLTAETRVVSFSIPQYDADTCFIEVYVNGILDNRYTLNGSIITFDGSLVAGTVVTVNCYKSIDGTGIESVAEEITELQNKVATLDGISKFTYKCTGLNDNIALSQIARAIYAGSYTVGTLSTAAEAFLQAIGGNTYLATLDDNSQVTIAVSGHLGATTPFSGSGTASSRYKWFELGIAEGQARRLTFDFKHCDQIDITCSANTDNIIFFGTDLNMLYCNCSAHSAGTNCAITMCTGQSMFGRMNFENCIFIVRTSAAAVIGENGDFTNCLLHVKSSSDNAYCISARSDALVRVFGGTQFAYTATASKVGAVFYVGTAQTYGVIMAYNVNCPTVAQSGYTQTYCSYTLAGNTVINGLVTLLTHGGTAAYRSISNSIARSKH